jgi:WD40 repeat protein
VWDLTDRADPRQIGTIEGHTDDILTVGLSSGGGLAVTASVDYTSVLWDLDDPARPERLTALTGPDRLLVRSMALSPDGHWLLGASADRTVRVWDLTPASAFAEPRAAACRIVGRGLTDDDHEWRRYIVDLPYRPTCP